MGLRDRLQTIPAVQGMQDGFLLWREACTLEDGGLLVARWLREDLRYLPWDTNKPADETLDADGFAEAMARLNEEGVMTTASQPGAPHQREYVSMVIPEHLVAITRTATEEEGLHLLTLARKRPRKKDAVPVAWSPRSEDRVTARLMDSSEGVALLVGLGAPRLGTAIKNGTCVPITIYDPVKGRRGEVQHLLDLLSTLAAAAGDDSSEGDHEES